MQDCTLYVGVSQGLTLAQAPLLVVLLLLSLGIREFSLTSLLGVFVFDTSFCMMRRFPGGVLTLRLLFLAWASQAC